MRIKATLIFFFFLFGVTISGCDNKLETSQKVTNSNTVSQTQNIQQPKDTTQEDKERAAWKKATKTTEYDSSRYHKPLK
ncbi:hypothetical protein [Desulfopila sp. IMCC35006]|uniref:hypothetical protein n=1 Tax=Desulfopila sp. IMCC35006 TaxID=2569542 RepID=UPI00142F178E|nr:hypothetical protein [Desulfopila sp. IMCC35006]